jgi:purine-nucleoside phosphorylase
VRVAAVSCITNRAAGLSAEPLSHADVQATAARVQADFVRLFEAWAARIGAEP